VSLTLVRLLPDLVALARWARQAEVPLTADDPGYALHVALRAVLGALAPQPWLLRSRAGRLELLGYSAAASEELQDAARLPSADDLAGQALGARRLQARAMPQAWRAGAQLSFETRVRPVGRCSRDRRELDYAVLRHSQTEAVDREAAYHEWLAREFARSGAVELIRCQVTSFRRVRSARRTQGPRRTVAWIEGPDVFMRGELRIADAEFVLAFLSRGLGRHRAFGFGCLLLAPRGVYR
jgi:CRISPR system Cascade subunit CasE